MTGSTLAQHSAAHLRLRAQVAPLPKAKATLLCDSAFDLNYNEGSLGTFSFKMVPASQIQLVLHDPLSEIVTL